MISQRAAVGSVRCVATRPPFRTRKPKLGAEPRGNGFPRPSPAIAESASTSLPSSSSSPSPSSSSTSSSSPTHYAVTLHRSAIGLPEGISATLEALGIRRRMQTVYHRFSPDIAGKILQVKELVEVRNVPSSEVRTIEQARKERKAVRGYEVVRKAKPSGAPALRQAIHIEKTGATLESNNSPS